MGVVLLVRHGQASFGADDYDVLSEVGWEQGRRLGAYLAERGVDPGVVLRGDMRRHRETVEAMVEGAGDAGVPWSAPVDVDRGWDEFDHLGVVAAYPQPPAGGRDRRAFQQLFELATGRWTAGDHDPEYPESFSAFRARVADGLDRAATRAGPGGTVVAVSSGGPVAAAAAALVAPEEQDPAVLARLWQRFNTVVVNSSVTRVIVGSTGPRLLTFNEHPHLEDAHLTYR